MIRRPPRSTRTDTLFPYTTLFRSLPQHRHDDAAGKRRALEKRFVDEFRGVAAGAKLRHSDLPFAEEVDAKAPVALDMFSGDRRFVDADQQGWRLHTHWRSAERRVGKECVSTCRSRGALYHKKKKQTNNKQ